MKASRVLAFVLLVATGCSGGGARTITPPPAPLPPPLPVTQSCRSGAPLRVHFYDVGQGLAALVDLPDGRHVLVDTGDAPHRSDCGASCEAWHEHFVTKLGGDLKGAPIDLLWITHPHSDHVGGATDVFSRFTVHELADNGRDLGKTEVSRTRRAAASTGCRVSTIEPAQRRVGLADTDNVHFTSIVPPAWPSRCKGDANECSILLRIDYCASSILFTGDAEAEEERLVNVGGPVSLLQVGHHGSHTSTTDAFVNATSPRYAVISSAKPGEGTNGSYCHPRASVVRRLSARLGGSTRPLRAYDADKCVGGDAGWADIPASDRLWATSRDGDVVLTTTGDGTFVRTNSAAP